MLTIEEHINGLRGIKSYLQWQMRKINHEGMGKQDAREIGETIDFAIECMQKQIPYKPKLYEDKFYSCRCQNVLMLKYKKYPNELNHNGLPFCLCCGQKIDWSEVNENDTRTST